MRIVRLLPWLVGCTLVVLAASAFAVPANQTITSGVYHPGDGTPDTNWQITSSNTLIWGSHALVPVGVVFRPTSLLSDQSASDAAWPADQAALDALSKHGVRQLIVDLTSTGPNYVPLVAVRPESLQRLISYLDKNNFEYGLDLNAFPPSGLTGITVDPAIYRQPAPPMGDVSIVKGIDGLASANYDIVSTRDDSVIASGQASVDGTNAAVKVGDIGGQNTVLLVYPTRILGNRTLEGRHCPDIWASEDRMRDDLLLYLGKISFGQGLRFFLDPIRDNFGLYGTLSKGFVPTSDAYRRGFKVWLTTKYSDRLSLLQRSWAITDADLPDFDTASRCVPLWNGQKGIEAIYDPTQDKQYKAVAPQSSIWTDIHAFQESSAADAMNGVAVALKHGVADIPVVYRWNLAVSDKPASIGDGYDGLMLTSAAHGDALIDACARTVSSVDRSNRSLWLLSTQVPPILGAGTGSDSSTPPAIDRTMLADDADVMTQLGVRGIFDDLGANPARMGDSLTAVRSVEVQLDLEGSTLGSGVPNNIYFPTDIGLTAAFARRLGPNSWWLPAQMDTTRVALGPDIEGYSMRGPAGGEFVVFSKTPTPQHITLQFTSLDHPFQMLLNGTTKMLPVKKGKSDLIIGPDPVVLAGIAKFPVPDGAIETETAEVSRLIKIGTSANAPMDSWISKLSYITDNPLISDPDQAATQFQMLAGLAEQIRHLVSPYEWVEAESPSAQTYAYSLESDDASGGAYLWLDGKASGDTGPSADYPFNIEIPGDYDVWASIGPATTTGVYQGAPLTVTFDGGAPLSSSDARPAGGTYGTVANLDQQISGGFIWERLTSVHLTAGQHEMDVLVNGSSDATGRASVALDCFCIDRANFDPHGTAKPTF